MQSIYLRVITAILMLFTFIDVVQAEEVSSPKYFDEVVVTAKRMNSTIKDLPANVSVVTSEEIRASGALNAAEALDITAGLNIGNKGTLGNERTLRLRSGGNSAGQTLVLIDGMPANSVSLGFSNLSNIPASKIERIEIIKGAVSSLYGANALGGVVNIITRDASKKEYESTVNTGFGSYTARNYSASYSYSKDKFSILSDIGRNFTGGYRYDNDYTNTSLLLKPSYSLGENGKIGAKIFYLSSDLGVPGTNTTDIADYDGITEKAASTPGARMTDSNLYSQIIYENSLNDDSTIKASVYNRLETRVYTNPSITNTLSETVASGFDVQANIADDVVMGGDFKWDIFRRTNQLTSVLDIDQALINMSLFLQKTFKLNKLNATIGLRDDYHSIFGNQLNPSVLLEYELSETFALSGNIGRAFRSPTFEDLYSPFDSWLAWGAFPAGNTQGNASLLPETAWSGDIGLKLFLKESLLCKLSVYYSYINNLIQWSDIGADPSTLQEYRPQNIGLAYNQGVELELKHVLSKTLSHKLNYTLLDSRGKGEYDNSFVLMNYSPLHNLNYNIKLSLETGTRMFFVTRYMSSQWNLNGELGTQLPAYLLVDFRVAQAIGVYEAFIAVNNVMNTRYKTRNESPLPGRFYSAGISLRI